MNLNNLSVTYETEKGDLLEPHSGTVDLIGYIEVTFQSLNWLISIFSQELKNKNNVKWSKR